MRSSCVIDHIRILDGFLAAKFFQLRIELEQHYWTVEQNHDQEIYVDDEFDSFDAILVWIILLIAREQDDHLIDRVPDHCEHVEREEEQKQQEVLVVFVAKTIVDECAMMIKSLDALIAIVTMHGVFGPKIFAVDAYVVQMELFIDKSLHKAKKIFHERDVARIYQGHAIEEDCKGKEYGIEDNCGVVRVFLLA